MTAVVVGGLVGVAGCNTTNPKEGGFFGGVGGMASGAYDQRIEERQASLNRLRAAEAELSGERQSLEAQERARQAEIARLRAGVSQLDRETQSLKREVAGLQARDSTSAARLSELRERLSALDRRLDGVKRGTDALEGADGTSADVISRRQALEAERQQLEREYKALLDLTRQLAS
jgi:chromosome segregation ATPase